LQVICGPHSALAADGRDLDDRLAELETTAARGTSRPLQLNVYGQVNRAMMLWNDGFDSGACGVDNHTSSTRLRFVGRQDRPAAGGIMAKRGGGSAHSVLKHA
jgi:hypothetical protein